MLLGRDHLIGVAVHDGRGAEVFGNQAAETTSKILAVTAAGSHLDSPN